MVRRRLLAGGALLTAAAAIAIALLAVPGDLIQVVLFPLLVLFVVGAGWAAVTRTGVGRYVASGLAVLGIAAVVGLVLTGEGHGVWLAIAGALAVVSILACRAALPRTPPGAPVPGDPVGRAERGVLIMNPKSGGGKAERFDLAGEARRRGIEPIVLHRGDDLVALARDAVERGADVLAMAGGDGSQALVASVAAETGVAYICVPAGTRNHFALDLGLDRDDVVGALDAFGEAIERRVDLATVGDRVFVNNVSLGVYAKIVQSDEYRDAKRETAATMLPELLGPDAEPFGLHFTGPDGLHHRGAQMVLVANNPYVLTLADGFGTRARLDTGELGVASVEVRGPADVTQLVAAQTARRPQLFRGWHEWTTPRFVVDSDRPIEAGVDGEALVLDPPLVFESRPAALRVRIPAHAPGRSPAARSHRPLENVGALLRLVAGRDPDAERAARSLDATPASGG